MLNKQEILEKLTGIQSSRKSYYTELITLVEEMKRKNQQLAVINQLTQIQINASWPEISIYIATQLSQILPFELFALTLIKGRTFSSFFSTQHESGWQCHSLIKPVPPASPLRMTDLHQAFLEVYPAHYATSVPLCSQLNQVFGFLTMLHPDERKWQGEEIDLFQLIANHVGVSVENSLLFQDVHEKIKIEAQLIQSAKMAAIGEMAAGIAHELNSPLTAILGNVQLLMRELAASPATPMMKDIYQCGVRCKKIIQNLLTFSRQEEYLFEAVLIDEIVADVLGLIGYQLTVSGLTITSQLANPPLSFHGSRHQIEQIVINLLLNARDALAGRDHPQITIRSFLADEEERRYVGLSVHDNGIGIAPEHLQQIFQPFFSTKERTKGTGLGLSVSLGIAEAHGGKLFAESERNRYSTFTLLLPLLSSEEDEDEDGEKTCSDCG